jgi:hypothetical protein
MLEKHTERAWWSPIVHALVHVAIGTVIFIIIALAALVLGLFVHWLGTVGVSGYVIDVLTFTEYAIVTLDAIGLLWYLGVAGQSAWKEL